MGTHDMDIVHSTMSVPITSQEVDMEIPTEDEEMSGNGPNEPDHVEHQLAANQSTIADAVPDKLTPAEATDAEVAHVVGNGDKISPSIPAKGASHPVRNADFTVLEERDERSPSLATNPRAASVTQASDSTELGNEIARLKECLAGVSSKAAQRVLKEQWRKFIFEGVDEEHISFLLRAGLKNAPRAVIERVLRDNSIIKEPLLNLAASHPRTSSNPHVIQTVLQNVNVPDLLDYVSEPVIDGFMAELVKGVQVEKLVGWLAAGERLGFLPDDVLHADVESVEPRAAVTPDSREDAAIEAPPHTHNAYLNDQLASAHRDPLLAEQERNLEERRQQGLTSQTKTSYKGQRQVNASTSTQIQHVSTQYPVLPPQAQAPIIQNPARVCPKCNMALPTAAGYGHHINKLPCTKYLPQGQTKWKFWCSNCLSGFTQSVGLNYHKKNNVCGSHNTEQATPPSHQPITDENARPTPDQSYPRPMAPPRANAIVSSHPPTQGQGALHPPPTAAGTPTSQKPAQFISSNITPSRSGNTIADSEIKLSPGELPPERLRAYEAEMQELTDWYEKDLAEIPETNTEAQKAARRVYLKNRVTNKKSLVNKKYGVALRMRDSTKEARRAAGIGSALSVRLEDFRASPTAMNGSSPSSFASVNAPPSSGSRPANGAVYGSQPQSQPSSNQPQPLNDHRHPLTLPNQPFANLGPVADASIYAASQPTNGNFTEDPPHSSMYPQEQARRKRQRSLEDRDIGRAHPSASQAMASVELRTENPAASLAQRAASTQASADGAGASVSKSAGSPDGGRTREDAIALDSSDESSDDGDIPAVAPSPTTAAQAYATNESPNRMSI